MNQTASDIGSKPLAEYADGKIGYPDDTGSLQRKDIQTHAGKHEEEHIDGGRNSVDLLKERFVIGAVDIGRAEHHAAEQRGNIHHGTAAGQCKNKRAGQHNPMVRGTSAKDDTQESAENIGDEKHSKILDNREKHFLPTACDALTAGSNGR